MLSVNGGRAEGSLTLSVLQSPVMSPFVFPDNLEEGMRASVICSVIAGDPPVTISWYKNNDPIKSDQSIHIVTITDFVSSLVINNLTRDHSSNYTCRASSTVGNSEYTATMRVRSRPLFATQPLTQTTISGSSVRLDCVSDAYPPPVIRWKVSRVMTKSAVMTSSSMAILSSPRIHVLENGSLVIKSVQSEDSGHYTCEASNSVGDRSSETSADLCVYDAPVVTAQQPVLSVRHAQEIRISCTAKGSPIVSITWYRNGQLLPTNDQKTTINDNDIGLEKLSTLAVKNSSRNDTGLYTCTATNFYGSANAVIRVLVQEQPGPPIELHVLEISARSVSLSWSLDFDGNSPITGYEVHFKRRDEKWSNSKMMFVSQSMTNSVIVSGLEPSTEYNLRMRAENGLGKSGFSSELSVTTSIEGKLMWWP